MRTTSLIARDKHEESGNAETNRRRVLSLVQRCDGSTAVELWSSQWPTLPNEQLTRHEISRRLPELRAAGLVHNGERRKCRVKLNLQMTWFSGPSPSSEGESSA